jgi:pimeloyl-ACP methyl ester carboxylesterase
MDDVRAVMDAAGSDRAVVFGVSEGGPLSIVFAATHPMRTLGLILFGTSARFAWATDFPSGLTEAQHRRELEEIDEAWGTREYSAQQVREWGAPSQPENAQLIDWLTGTSAGRRAPGLPWPWSG